MASSDDITHAYGQVSPESPIGAGPPAFSTEPPRVFAGEANRLSVQYNHSPSFTASLFGKTHKVGLAGADVSSHTVRHWLLEQAENAGHVPTVEPVPEALQVRTAVMSPATQLVVDGVHVVVTEATVVYAESP